jgi:hypothetical protein
MRLQETSSVSCRRCCSPAEGGDNGCPGRVLQQIETDCNSVKQGVTSFARLQQIETDCNSL